MSGALSTFYGSKKVGNALSATRESFLMVVLQPIRARDSMTDVRKGCEEIGPSFITSFWGRKTLLLALRVFLRSGDARVRIYSPFASRSPFGMES